MVIEGKLADYFMDPKNGANRGAGVFALLFCAPLLAMIALAIKLGNGGPAFSAAVGESRAKPTAQARTRRGGSGHRMATTAPVSGYFCANPVWNCCRNS